MRHSLAHAETVFCQNSCGMHVTKTFFDLARFRSRREVPAVASVTRRVGQWRGAERDRRAPRGPPAASRASARLPVAPGSRPCVAAAAARSFCRAWRAWCSPHTVACPVFVSRAALGGLSLGPNPTRARPFVSLSCT